MSEFDPYVRLTAEVETQNRMVFTVVSHELYPGSGTSMRLTANRKQDNPQSKDAVFSAFDDMYDYYLPFPKSELAKPTINYFYSEMTINIVGTFETRKAQLTCAQQL